MTRRLLMVRHGQTTYNATRRMQGQLDTSLSERGKAQAYESAQVLRRAGVGLIVSSDLSRAHDTACIIAEELNLPVRTDARLRETGLGQWQGMRVADVDEQFPGARAIWRHDATWAPPGGESRVEVAARARPVIDELMVEYEGWDDAAVLVVAHGGTISALTSSLLGLEISQYPLFSGLSNTRWAELRARPFFTPGMADALDNEPEALQPHFTPETVRTAQWYLDSWNSSAVAGS